MYREEELVKIVSISKKIDDINLIITRHKNITNTLKDAEGQPAILMLLGAISEQLSKLHKKDAKVWENFEKEDIKGFIDVRNFIAHDYDGINLAIIEDILRYDIPRVENVIKKILNS